MISCSICTISPRLRFVFPIPRASHDNIFWNQLIIASGYIDSIGATICTDWWLVWSNVTGFSAFERNLRSRLFIELKFYWTLYLQIWNLIQIMNLHRLKFVPKITSGIPSTRRQVLLWRLNFRLFLKLCGDLEFWSMKIAIFPSYSVWLPPGIIPTNAKNIYRKHR